jgi:hypothetical protein
VKRNYIIGNLVIYNSITTIKFLVFGQRDWAEITRMAKPCVSVEKCPVIRQDIMLTRDGPLLYVAAVNT